MVDDNYVDFDLQEEEDKKNGEFGHTENIKAGYN